MGISLHGLGFYLIIFVYWFFMGTTVYSIVTSSIMNSCVYGPKKYGGILCTVIYFLLFSFFGSWFILIISTMRRKTDVSKEKNL